MYIYKNYKESRNVSLNRLVGHWVDGKIKFQSHYFSNYKIQITQADLYMYIYTFIYIFIYLQACLLEGLCGSLHGALYTVVLRHMARGFYTTAAARSLLRTPRPFNWNASPKIELCCRLELNRRIELYRRAAINIFIYKYIYIYICLNLLVM